MAKAFSGTVKLAVGVHGHANVEQLRVIRLSKIKQFLTQNKYVHA